MREQKTTGYPSVDKPWLKNYKSGAADDVISGIDMSAYDFMCARVKTHLEMPAIEYFGARITYAKLLGNIEKWTKAFSAYGIDKGDFVSICLPNIPELIYGFYALNRLGAIANFIDPRAASSEIECRIKRTNSKLLIVIENICISKIAPITSEIGIPCVAVSPTSAFSYSGFSVSAERIIAQLALSFRHQNIGEAFVSVSDFLEAGKSVASISDAPFSPNMPISALYTSGTTADTMSAGLFSNENYNAMVKNMAYGSEYIKPGKRFLGVVPLFVAYGSFNGMHNALCNAWMIVMIPVFKPSDFSRLVIKHRANAVLGVPKFWEQFVDHGGKELSFLEIPVCGGDWIARAQTERINEALMRFHSKQRLKIGYGATEFGGCVTVTSDESAKYNPDSVGIFLPGNSAMVIDPETKDELSYGEAGELCISGPTMMLQYFDEPEKTAEITIWKGETIYYRTGDIARITEKGELIFCDRFKRVMMRPDGHTVSCSLIENAIISHTAVQNCAVVGLKISQNKSGVIPTAFVILHKEENESQALADVIDRYCSKYLGERDKALAITFVHSLPYTPVGKVNFRQLEHYTFSDRQFYIFDSTFFD